VREREGKEGRKEGGSDPKERKVHMREMKGE
jgi:hypothetical protein